MIRPATVKPSPNNPHPGISMHRIRGFYEGVGDGPAGLMAAAGAILVCIFGFPHARWFLVFSIVVGFVAFQLMRRWHERKPVEVEKLSIFKS